MAFDTGSGCGLAVGLVLLVALVVGALLVVEPVMTGLSDMAASQAEIARERTDAARERNVHAETMFQLWTVALASFRSENVGLVVVLSALLGAVVALVAGWVVGRFLAR